MRGVVLLVSQWSWRKLSFWPGVCCDLRVCGQVDDSAARKSVCSRAEGWSLFDRCLHGSLEWSYTAQSQPRLRRSVTVISLSTHIQSRIIKSCSKVAFTCTKLVFLIFLVRKKGKKKKREKKKGKKKKGFRLQPPFPLLPSSHQSD